MDTIEFGAAFWLTITGVLTAFISGALVYAIKSKCTQCSVCYGLISIQRDVQAELTEEKNELDKGLNPYALPPQKP